MGWWWADPVAALGLIPFLDILALNIPCLSKPLSLDNLLSEIQKVLEKSGNRTLNLVELSLDRFATIVVFTHDTFPTLFDYYRSHKRSSA